MKARVKWVEAMRFIGGSGTGHGVIMDASATPEGETTLGPSPMEMLLLGMGGCTVYDVVAILQKMRQPVEDVIVELEAERADEPPKVFTKIHAQFTVVGDVPLAKAEEAVSLSADKYCSASRMLAKTAEITHAVEVVAAQP
ncbi:MAG: OsmC family protein [Magnetovibrio sp.]|nr:OsmC family protein [Magnetovibrio sp.]